MSTDQMTERRLRDLMDEDDRASIERRGRGFRAEVAPNPDEIDYDYAEKWRRRGQRRLYLDERDHDLDD